jgi:hypothetical protein
MFDKLFNGSDRAHGIYTLPKNKKGKQKGTAKTIKEPATKELYDKHIAGEIGLGIVPIDSDSNCHFAAIDIDTYDINLHELENDVNNFKLPLVVCSTKSGGAHLYLFLKEPIPAEIINPAMALWANRLGFPNVEIFPKQKKLKKNELGNWINLPYFNANIH